MKNLLRLPLLSALGLALLGSGSASAALVSITTSTLSGSGSQLISTGEILFAWNCNGNALTPPTVNGITFSNSLPSLVTVGGFPALPLDDAAMATHYSGDMFQVMSDYMGTNTNSNGTITLTGLTAGWEYRVQFLHHQDVNNNGIRQMEVRYGGAGGTSGGVVGVGDNQGYITTAIFTADSSTQLFTFDPGTDDRAIVNGAVLALVPEPASAPLGSLGIIALLRRRRH